MPYQVSWQSVSMKSQRPVHVLGAALAADSPQQAPAAARIVAAKIPSFVMTAPCPNFDHRDLEDVGCKTHSDLGRKISIQWRPRHSFLHGPDYESRFPGAVNAGEPNPLSLNWRSRMKLARAFAGSV